MPIRCARCKGTHATHEEVRACFNGPLPARSKPPDDLRPDRITPKQEAFIEALLEQVGQDTNSLPKPLITYDKYEASYLIDSLQEERRTTPPREQRNVIGRPNVDGKPPPDGTYTVILKGDEDDYVTIRFKTPDHGRWRDVQLAMYLAGPDNTADYIRFANETKGGYRIWSKFTDAIRLQDALVYMLQGDAGQLRIFGQTYALRSNNCYRCGRLLTVKSSIDAGLGPICAGKEYA